MGVTILPGSMGTLLASRGVPTPAPGWSAHAIESHPEMVAAIHREYAAAGARLHIADTFRTQPRVFPDRWERLTCRAVGLARGAAALPVAGSIAPVGDCYRPELSPPDARGAHRAMARALAAAGCDLLLCETFPSVDEGLAAAQEAAATGLPVWLSFTAGPDGSLLTPHEVRDSALEAAKRGASAVLVNCTAAVRTLPYVRALAEAGAKTGLTFGAFANAGAPEDRCGWGDPDGPTRYADLAGAWVAAGATLIGSCCGTGPGHTAELARRFAPA
jgi:S-methylmethionine-dependent homocysteine/selenocysteine methylase